jgi:hypothetical protein
LLYFSLANIKRLNFVVFAVKPDKKTKEANREKTRQSLCRFLGFANSPEASTWKFGRKFEILLKSAVCSGNLAFTMVFSIILEPFAGSLLHLPHFSLIHTI